MPTANLTIKEFPAPVEPGTEVTLLAVLENNSTEVNWYRLEVKGDIQEKWWEWIYLQPSRTELYPGSKKDITVTFLPPKTPTSTAGTYNWTLIALWESETGQQTEVAIKDFTITIKPYSANPDFLVSNLLQSGERTTLSLTNNCNSRQTYHLQGEGKARFRFGEGRLESSRSLLEISPGETKPVSMRVDAQHGPWFRLATAEEQLLLKVLSEDKQELAQEPITLGVPPRLPSLLLIMLGLLLCSLVSAFVWWPTLFGSPEVAEGTAPAMPADQAVTEGPFEPPPTITPRPADAILQFTTAAQSITEGECVTLTWVEGGLETIKLNGEELIEASKQVCPTSSTVYKLEGLRSADDPNPVVREIKIEVAAAPTTAAPQTVVVPVYLKPGYILNGDELADRGITLTIEDVGGCTTKRPAVGVGTNYAGVRYFTTFVPKVIPGCEDCVPDLCKSVPLSINFDKSKNVKEATVYFLTPTNAHQGVITLPNGARKTVKASQNVAYYATYKKEDAVNGTGIERIDVGVNDQSQPPAVVSIEYEY